jgi:hypothetical protein
MKIKEYIQILLLGLVLIGTTIDVLYVGLDVSIEMKIDFEKDNESSEKEKSDKKESKYLDVIKQINIDSDEKLANFFSTKLIISHSYVDEDLIPPEV